MSEIISIFGWLTAIFIAWKVWRRDWSRRWTSSMDHARRALAALILAAEAGDDVDTVKRLARTARVEVLAGDASVKAACGDCVLTRLLHTVCIKVGETLKRCEQSGACDASDQDALRIALGTLSQNP